MVGFCYLRVLGNFYECGTFGESVNDKVIIGGGVAPIHHKDATLCDFKFDNLMQSKSFRG
jgi:hypothetical protein